MDEENSSRRSDLVPIRLLLVDNYDSYTYNLFDRLRSVPGVEVVVALNDQLPETTSITRPSTSVEWP